MGEYTICGVNKQPEELVFNENTKERIQLILFAFNNF